MAARLAAWWELAGLEPVALPKPARPPSPLARSPDKAAPAPAAARVAASAVAAPPRAADAVDMARAAAEASHDLEALREAIAAFEGCGLKRTARGPVFADGAPDAPVMLMGEAPGGEEDEAGLPFVGPSGRFLDRMLASVGLSRRENLRIANVSPWRPPGNRKLTADEIAVCAPFARRHVALVRPRLLLLAGGAAAQALLGTEEGIMKLRGKPRRVSGLVEGADIPVHCLLHPAYLLRRPQDKALMWKDLLRVEADISALGVALSSPLDA